MRVALFATCVVDTMVPQVAMATARLLERLGHEVVVPPGQSCCGQMHVNTGYRREAVPIVANHVKAFAGAQAIVAPSGSCVASIHHQQAAARARDLAEDGQLLVGQALHRRDEVRDELGSTLQLDFDLARGGARLLVERLDRVVPARREREREEYCGLATPNFGNEHRMTTKPGSFHPARLTSWFGTQEQAARLLRYSTNPNGNHPVKRVLKHHRVEASSRQCSVVPRDL